MTERIVVSDLLSDASKLESLPWAPFRDGVSIVRLYGDGASGSSAALLRYEPSASVPLHEHPGYEHILVLAGEQSDARGRYPKGTLLISPPGSSHRVVSESGCIVLAIWNEPVRFA